MRIGFNGTSGFSGVNRGTNRLGLPKLGSALKQTQAWRNKMRAMRQSFESTSNALTNAVLGAQGNLASAQSEFAVKMATKRMQDDARKRLDAKVDDVTDRLDNLKTDITV